MSEKQFYRLAHDTARKNAIAAIYTAPEFWTVTLNPPRRSDVQSDKMHAMAGDLSKQVPWMGQKLSVEQWKRFATAKLKKDMIVFDCDDRGQPSMQAGLIVLGARTREMSSKEVSEIIEWFYWMGAQHGVVWREPKHSAEHAIVHRGQRVTG
jgi:hypothetical protein